MAREINKFKILFGLTRYCEKCKKDINKWISMLMCWECGQVYLDTTTRYYIIDTWSSLKESSNGK